MTVPASPQKGSSPASQSGKKRRVQQGSRAKPKSIQVGRPAGRSPAPPPAPERSPEFLYRIAVHEAGHAVIRHMYLLSIVEKVTIEGSNGGGVTWHIDVQHEPLELMFDAELMALLAGRAAEECILELGAAHRNGGADSDLALASDIAFRMETALGFGKKWPLLHWPPSDRAALYAKDPDLAERVHDRLRRALAAARTLVRKQEEAIRWLADILLHHPTLEGPLLAQVLEELDKRPNR